MAASVAKVMIGESHSERGSRQLRALAHAVGLGSREGEITRLFQEMVAPWGEGPIETQPRWLSDVCDDHTPYEFSFVLGPEPELRLLVEALGDKPNLESNWLAGRELSARLARQFDISLARLRAIEAIFAPGPGSTLAIWHAVSFFRDRPPEFKVYFDAQAQGLGRAGALLEEALSKLGFADAWSRVASAARRGTSLDEFKYLSLDLAKSPESRVKLYVRHRAATLADVRSILEESGAMPAGEASAFCRAMTGTDGPFLARPLFTCTTLTEQRTSGRTRRTLYVPISAYVNDDAVAQARVASYLREHGLDAATYHAGMAAIAGRPLADGVGLHSYVSLRYDTDRPRMTFYVAPESYQMRQASQMESGSVPCATETKPLPAEEIVRRYEHDLKLDHHPLFQRLGREPVNLSRLWLIMANFWEAIVHDFPERLSRAVAAVKSDAVRSIMVKQLNDEMGEGDFSRAHKAMFQRLVAALDPYKMPGEEAKLMAPGKQLSQRLGAHLLSSNQWESVGALMMIEIYGSQVDSRLGTEFRRQNEIDPSALLWLNLHETLEVDHAGDSLTLAKLVPTDDSSLEAVWRGALGVAAGAQEYFDALYELCFS